LFMDHHNKVEGLTAQAVADAHRRDLETQGQYGVNYIKYWFDEGSGQVWCLVEAPDPDSAKAVHKEAHGLVADDITEVREGA
jgi:Nickel responsive protein SCO4226-like